MDVEDPINDQADDAALDIAQLFTAVGVRGSFCLTGEKCRTLFLRGRTDVLDAFRGHCLGLHTDTHSYHPTTMELLADCTFDEGVVRVCAAESRGFDAFETAFGRKPEFWGGAGNTWSPEITVALERLGIPAYVYALTSLPDNAVHQFNGTLALPQALSISETDWADDDRARQRGAEVLSAIGNSQQPWLGLFVGHPTRFRYDRFWDAPFANGVTPVVPERSQAVSNEVYARSKENLASFLSKLKREVPILGVDEVTRWPWEFEQPTPEELDYFQTKTSEVLRGAKHWPIHRPDLDLSTIAEKTMALSGTLLTARLSRSATGRFGATRRYGRVAQS